ncbi:conjugal transfer protein TraI [Flavobacterium rakeshii]|uniref:Conjugal transfer protein TraI n=1 Tax=Flavobacterium rakeshii TaxID=1038845 RepID=A0A6N8HFT0_9FLAO|nr:conjugal transfer protein TraI [Flavobacterium rakeshii]MUV04587.1 conjugal transfer protein TraI [Flavobacterium rakeshii]
MKIQHWIRQLFCGLLLIGLTSFRPASPPVALPLFGLVREAVVRAIKAMDLKIQRLQNKTIWLQNAQQEIENTLTKLKLEDISGWAQRQRDLYRDYYEELQKVKYVISYYQRIRDVTQKQATLLVSYQQVWPLLVQGGHFNEEELSYMQQVYNGILAESLSNMDDILGILESFTTSMSDAQRLELINTAAAKVEVNYLDLLRFNRENLLLQLQRSKTQQDTDAIRRLHGINSNP